MATPSAAVTISCVDIGCCTGFVSAGSIASCWSGMVSPSSLGGEVATCCNRAQRGVHRNALSIRVLSEKLHLAGYARRGQHCDGPEAVVAGALIMRAASP